MDKSTGKPFEIDGKNVTSEVTFTPEKSSGEVKVSFNFDASGIKTNTELVVFETLYREGVEIAAHADIDDKGQTVTVIPPAPPVPQTGDESNLGFWIGLGAIALGGLISVAVIYLKRKRMTITNDEKVYICAPLGGNVDKNLKISKIIHDMH